MNIKIPLLLLVALSVGISACKSKAELTPVKGSGKDPVVDKSPDKPKDNDVKPVKPSRRDTVVVLDTLTNADQWAVVRRKMMDGVPTGAVDTLRKIALRPSKPAQVLKDKYTITVMLPFLTGEYKRLGSNPSKSRMSLEFLSGMKFAFQDLQAEGVNLKVNIIDSNPDSLGLDSVLLRTELEEADIILGPVGTEELRKTAEFARLRNKTLVSPLNPRDKMVDNNNRYVQLSPSIKSHCEGLLDYARQRYGKQAKVIILSRKDSSEQALAANIQLYNTRKGESKLAEVTCEDNRVDWEKLRSLVSGTDTAVILVPSYQNEAFVSNVVNVLSNNIANGKFVVFGMPKWLDFQRLNTENLELLKVFISQYTYPFSASPEADRFRWRYFREYGMPPSDNVYAGYDSALYLGRMLKKYGVNFPYYATSEASNYVASAFRIEEVIEKRKAPDPAAPNLTVIRQFENKRINVLRYEGYRYRRVY